MIQSLYDNLVPVIDRVKDKLLLPSKAIRVYTTLPTAGLATEEYIVGDKKYKYESDEFIEIADLTKAKPTNVFFHKSSYIEIIDVMKTFKDDYNFPLIFVNQYNIVQEEVNGIISVTIPQIILASQSLPYWTSDIREIQTFSNILRPLYTLFIESLEAYGLLNVDTKKTTVEHFFYGNKDENGNTVNLFNNYVDAIEIKNLKLVLINKTC